MSSAFDSLMAQESTPCWSIKGCAQTAHVYMGPMLGMNPRHVCRLGRRTGPCSDTGEDAQSALPGCHLPFSPLIAAGGQHVYQRAQLWQQTCSTQPVYAIKSLPAALAEPDVEAKTAEP